MPALTLSDSTRLLVGAVSAFAAVAAMFPAAASALEFEVVNESGRGPEGVYVTVVGDPATYDVPGMVNDEPKKLSEIPGQKLTIEKLVSGRVYISYGAGVKEGVTLESPTRFDWAELNVHPVSTDVANLTAVDQFGIGMRLDTYSASDEHLEWLGDANSNTIFEALQQIPGGPQATVKGGGGNILRVVSPLHSSAYPDLGDYVRSMSGKTIALHTAFFGTPFTTSKYSGTFAADGSITLSGTSNPPGAAPAMIPVAGAGLIEDIYTGAHTPNNLEGAIRRDLLAGFSTGLWDGKYGNDALSFCTNPQTTTQGSWCPNGFNQPAFGDARTELSSFPTCEQYAAVINQYADSYGNPYSDASKKVAVSLDQPASGGSVKTLKLTILPDSGDAHPNASGNPNCGAAAPSPSPNPSPTPSSSSASASASSAAPSATQPLARRTRVGFDLLRRARVRGHRIDVGRVDCSAPCRRIKAIAKHGRRVLARRLVKRSSRTRELVLRLTRFGRRTLARRRRLRARLDLWITPAGQPTTHLHRLLLVISHARR